MTIETVGTSLRRQREMRRMRLAEVSRVTRIPLATLEAIEQDHFDDLPGEVFVKGFLRSYAQTVGLIPEDVVARYSASRQISVHEAPLPVASPVHYAAREGQSRRFGVAIALVLLLILVTLALSIVLKPRGRDMPPELSDRSPSTDVHAPLLG